MVRRGGPERWRRSVEAWVGTLTQVIGLGLLVYAIGLDRFRNPAIFPGAIGLLGLKYVIGGKG